MKKTGYVISLIGGVLAIALSVLMIITGPYFAFGGDVSRFIAKNGDKLDEMWADIGDYEGVEPLLRDDLSDYIDGFTDVIKNIDADELRDIGEEYNEKAFEDLAIIARKFEQYLPSLIIGAIACVAASIAALIGAQAARTRRVAGGVTVLSAAALTLIFSLIAGSIISMALASLLLTLGGVLQLAKPKTPVIIQQPEEVTGGGIQ